MARFRLVVSGVFVLLFVTTIAYTRAISAPLAAKTETPTIEITQSITETITLEPTATPTVTPTAEPIATQTPQPPTPWVVILITPTPNTVPPSWNIPDLDKKIKDKKGYLPGGFLFSVSTLPLFADSPIPVEIDDKINNEFWPWLVQREWEYYNVTGKFCQMLSSHANAPADGNHEYPDMWFSHPTDQQYTWGDLNAIQFEPIPVAITIDIYRGAEGPGYAVNFDISISGVVWRKTKTFGPESGRSQDWAIVEAFSP